METSGRGFEALTFVGKNLAGHDLKTPTSGIKGPESRHYNVIVINLFLYTGWGLAWCIAHTSY